MVLLKETDVSDECPCPTPSENPLTPEQLDKIMDPENLEKLRPLLSNPKVRELILKLDSSNPETIRKDYEDAMKDHEFVKFARLVLRVVDAKYEDLSDVDSDTDM